VSGVVTHSAGTTGAIQFNASAVLGNDVTVSNSLDFTSGGETANLTANDGTFNLVTNLAETDTAVGVFDPTIVLPAPCLALSAGASDNTVTYVNGFTGSLWKIEIVVP
jgi:hypothetical protein